MSRIGQLTELKALRAEIEALKVQVSKLEAANAHLLQRLEVLEAKRGPGRPPKNDGQPTRRD